MSDARTFIVQARRMRGRDVTDWQQDLMRKLRFWGVRDYPFNVDGVYGVATRSLTALVFKHQGIAQSALEHGVTPELRTKFRNANLTPEELKRFHDREPMRDELVERWSGGGTAAVMAKIITSANGYTSGHDGVDLICPAESPAFAIVRSVVARVSDDWWGLGAPRDPKVKDKGDGIVILRSLVDIGPIRKGDYLGYGHGEKPRVDVGDRVEAGRRICDAGMANAWHLHFMHFRGDPGKAGDGGPKGKGNRDPMPAVDFCRRNA